MAATEAPPRATDESTAAAGSTRLAALRDRLVVPMPQDRVWGWLGPLVVAAIAGFLRFDRLAVPHKLVFDETYYAKDAWSLLHHGVELGADGKSAGFVAHPPLGKWAIAMGQWAFGNDSFGWRFSAAVAGTLSVLLVARIGRRLFRSTLLGCFAGLLLAVDGLHFVQSRVALLDIFLMTWLLAAFGALLLDRDRSRGRLADGRSTGCRPWRIAAGACLGAACATKWSGVYYVVAFGLLAFAWDIGTRRALGVRRPWLAALRRDTAPLLLALVGIGAIVYTASWTGWFLGDSSTAYDHDRFLGGRGLDQYHPFAVFHGWLQYHQEVWHFHTTLTSSHDYQSHPIGWLLLARPVSYFYTSPQFGQLGCRAVENCSKEVLAIGTPAIWWASIPAIITLLWVWVARRDWRAAALLTGIAAGIVPWLYNDFKERTEFLFYALPSLPFLALALAMVAGMVLGRRSGSSARRQAGAALVGGYALLVVVNFLYLYPILAAKVIPYPDWHKRMWFGSWI